MKDRLECGDAVDLLRTVPDGSVDCVVTDPPYLIKTGKSDLLSGNFQTAKAQTGRLFVSNSIKLEDYIGELYRVLRDKTLCHIMTNNLNLPHYLDVVTHSDFKFVKDLIWNKRNALPGTYYMSSYEHILLLRKGNFPKINDCTTTDIITCSIPREKRKYREGKAVSITESPHGHEKPSPPAQRHSPGASRSTTQPTHRMAS